MRMLWISWLALLVGCASPIPATVPPQLVHTPGTPITVTEDQVQTAFFTLTYPDGWRVIRTSVSGTPLQIVLAAPVRDATPSATITVSLSPLTVANYDPVEQITVRGRLVYIGGQAGTQQEQLDRALALVRASLQ